MKVGDVYVVGLKPNVPPPEVTYFGSWEFGGPVRSYRVSVLIRDGKETLTQSMFVTAEAMELMSPVLLASFLDRFRRNAEEQLGPYCLTCCHHRCIDHEIEEATHPPGTFACCAGYGIHSKYCQGEKPK